jgi:hypothetical protein
MLTWKKQKAEDMPIYTAKDQYSNYEIRSWPYDESGEGRFQACKDGYHKGNFERLADAKDYLENWC